MSTTLQMPSTDHKQFDDLCSRVDEWTHLPAYKTDPTDPEREAPEDAERDASLNGLILAGLVSPH
ncbi:MAG TPA: hypothetical protein VGH93_14130 [Solirubrobacteraceae bacterium]|jgi:hypothetical protein